MSLTSGDVVDDAADAVPGARSENLRQPYVLPARWFWWAFASVTTAAAAVVWYYGRRVFLWSDDYVFLFDARDRPLTWDWLASPLFGHFSPVSQFTDVLVAANLPAHPWLVRGILLALSVAVVGSIAFAMLCLFGRTWPTTLIGIASAAASLGLLPLVNWWTAGLNIMPAMIGVALCLGAVVRLVRGGSLWWGAPAIGGYLLAVVSWELGITAVGYAAIWTLLFRVRVQADSWRALLRRTWWVWALLAIIAVCSVVNYRLNYYQPTPTPAPTTDLAVQSLATSLFTIQLPLTLGFYDPSHPWFQLLGIVLGVVVLVVLIALTMFRIRRAWRGWVFALIGWLIPITAVVLSRVGYIGVRAVEQPMYYYLPTLLLIVGVLEAWTAPWKPRRAAAREATGRPPRRVALGIGAVARNDFCGGLPVQCLADDHQHQLRDDRRPGHPGTRLHGQSRGIRARPAGVRRAVQWDQRGRARDAAQLPGPQQAEPDDQRLRPVSGSTPPTPPGSCRTPPALAPATIRWPAELTLTSSDTQPMTGGITMTGSGPGFCFTVDSPDAVLRWDLPAPVSGGPPVVRTMATVAAPTPVRVSTVTEPRDAPVVTNVNPRTWTPDQTGRLDTTAEPQVSSVVIDSMTVGTSMCLTSIRVGTVGTP